MCLNVLNKAKCITILLSVSLLFQVSSAVDAINSEVNCGLIGDLNCDGLVVMNEIKQLNVDLLQGEVSYDIVYEAIKNFKATSTASETTYGLRQKQDYMPKTTNEQISEARSNTLVPLVQISPASGILSEEENDYGEGSRIFDSKIPWRTVGSNRVLPPIRVGKEDFAKSAPLPLGNSVPDAPFIRHDPIGRHIMLMPVYAERTTFLQNYPGSIGQSGKAYFFGRDFSLGTINNNYDVNFITQFLADP